MVEARQTAIGPGLQPLTRLLALLIVAPALSSLALVDLCGLGALVILGYGWSRPGALRRLAFGLGRLKWLLLGIAVLYLGFTPGEALSTWTPGLTREGLHEGLRRVLVLVCLLAAVYWLLAVTPVPQLVAALDQLFWPLRRFGVPTDRFTRRIAMTLDALDAVEAQYRSLRAAGLSGLTLAAAWIGGIERDPPPAVPITAAAALPRAWEWGLLALLLGVAWAWPR